MTRILFALMVFLGIASTPAQLAAAGAPEVSLLRNGVEIADGGTDTVYGAVAGTPLTITYTIANVGALPLSLGAVVIETSPAPVNCASLGITTAPSSTILANSTTTLVLSVNAQAQGLWSFSIRFGSDDADESPTNWVVTGTAAGTGLAAPEIAVSRAAVNIADGGTDTLAGSLAKNFSEDVTYTITNQGSAPLQITSAASANIITGCSSASIEASPVGPVAPGASTTLIVRLTPNADSWSLTISFTCNDSDEGTSNWTMSGSSVSNAPEIQVTRIATMIPDGGIDALSSGGTADSTLTLTYVVENVGASSLTVSVPTFSPSPTNCSATISRVPQTSPFVTSTSFDVSIIPSSNALWSVNISMLNNDGNETPYNWTIRGTATGSTTNNGGVSGGGGGGCGGGTPAGLLLVAAGMLLSMRGLSLIRARRRPGKSSQSGRD